MKLTSLLGKKVYSILGKYIGTVVDVMVDLRKKEVVNIDVSTKSLNGKQRILIPYRWLYTVEDIVLVKEENV
ncbi:MAG: PRC-barrel domain-containing protein [Candidatus Baldrarchaeia archaeon]